jgi:capsular exopolysaccharide synthesis family protein
MSKIFEGLKKGRDEIADVVLHAVDNPPPQNVSVERPAATAAGAPQARSSEEISAPEAIRLARRGRHAAHPPARIMPLKVSELSPLLPFDSRNWRASEQYRIIRTRIIQHSRQPRMILISSACSGDGKTVTAINLAGALSLKTDANVLLLDGDMRRAAVHAQLSLPRSPGLTDVLLGKATLETAVIRSEQFSNLFILPAGEPRTNPSDLLESPKWHSICEQARNQFRYLVVDSPPAAAVADYDLLQSSCDGVLMVARPDHTNLQDCLKAVSSAPKDKLLGVVMNSVKDWLFAPRSYGAHAYSPEVNQAPEAAAR